MRTRRPRDPVLSRRNVIQALGAAALAGLPGSRRAWASVPAAPRKITNGYTDQQSYRPGDRVTLFLSTDSPQRTVVNLVDYTSKIVQQIPVDLYTQTPVGPSPWETGFGYQETVTFTLPMLRSGVYLVEGLVPIIVKQVPLTSGRHRPSPIKPAEIVILYPTNTIAAYNALGGRSMYSEPVAAPIVSFLRPSGQGSQLAFFSPFLEWFADPQIRYRPAYIADIDLEDYNEISRARLLVVIGHSEYWTRRARESFDRFVLDGGNVLLLSGNNMWWQVRYSDDRTQMICYKRSPDPIQDPLLKTINWSQSRLRYPILGSLGADFTHGGFGIGYRTSGGFKVVAENSPLFRGLFIRGNNALSISTLEYDGAPLLNSPPTQGVPRLNLDALQAHQAELIGYEYCAGNEAETGSTGVPNAVATWMIYKRTATSGTIINGASTNWCSRTGAFGPDGFRVRKIIVNMLDSLLSGESVFSR